MSVGGDLLVSCLVVSCLVDASWLLVPPVLAPTLNFNLRAVTS